MMGSRLFSILNRLRYLNNVKTSFETRSLSTIDSKTRTLYSKISAIGHPSKSVVPELEKWVESGKKAQVAKLQNIIQDLRKRKRFGHALEVSEWMGSKGVCESTPGYYAVQLDLIGRVRGVDSAESYFNNLSDEHKTNKTYGALLNCYVRECLVDKSHFNNLSDEHKTNKTYGALLNCYVRECLVDKSLSHFNKMKEMGFAVSLNYNNIMCLYTYIDEHEKVPGVLTEMKEDGISPDNYSYRICINSYGARSDINGMEKILHEMGEQAHISMDWNTYATVANFYIKAGLTDKAVETLKQAEEKLEKKDGFGYNHLISLYTSLGNKAEALRLWEKKKTSSKRYINGDYSTMLGSLVKLGDVEEAHKLLKEWESSGNAYDFRVPNILLIGYSQNGMIEKAEEMLNDIIEKGKTPIPNSWGIVSAGYLKKGEMEKATESIKKALKLLEGNEGWRPNPEVISGILNWLCDNADVNDVAHFVENLSNVIPMNREMYHALIKANIRGGGGEVDQLVKRMKADQIEEDEETKKILSFRQAEA